MMLTKDELIAALHTEIRVLLHLASKVDESRQDYRPSAKQRSTLELLRYLAIMGPIHARTVRAETFDMSAFAGDLNTSEARANTWTLDQTTAEIAKLPALFTETIGSCTDADLRATINLFGQNASRGSMFVGLLLTHYAAYRMQLFLYLKASGQPELNTMNLWVGCDGAMPGG
ncbi:MAG: hypothetical protein HY820_45330 [Acidobacteria bacterium]|nr:hypothetical protein [Acidobacteriota bacterium]